MTNLRFRIVAEDASPPRLISHHASSSPPEGLTREQTTAPSSATSTSGKAESNGTSLAQAEAPRTGGEDADVEHCCGGLEVEHSPASIF